MQFSSTDHPLICELADFADVAYVQSAGAKYLNGVKKHPVATVRHD